MDWLATDDIVDLYQQRDHERAYSIDVRGESHFMGEMDDSYLCNVMRFVGKNRHIDAAKYAILYRQMSEVATWGGPLGPSEMNEDALLQDMDHRFDEIVSMAEAPWDTPLVQNLARHIYARTV